MGSVGPYNRMKGTVIGPWTKARHWSAAPPTKPRSGWKIEWSHSRQIKNLDARKQVQQVERWGPLCPVANKHFGTWNHKNKSVAADMDPVKEKLLTPDEVPDVEMALRTAVTRYTGGQGYVKCSCKTNCTTSRCSCTKKQLKCNSRCHPGRSCSNI